MTRVNGYWWLPIFSLVGFVASWTIMFFNRTSITMLVVMIPLLMLVVPFVIFESTSSFARLFRSLKWWHLLWFCIFLSGLVFRNREASDIGSDPVDGAAFFRLAVEFVTFLVLAVRLALHKTDWIGSLFRGLIGVVTAYALICLASTAWSAFPPWTAFKSLEYLLDVILIAAILVEVNSIETYRTFINWTWFLCGLLLISVWVGVLIAPELALHKMQGIFGWQIQGVMPAVSADSVGSFGALIALVAFARLMLYPEREISNRVWYIVIFLTGCVTMFFAQSRTAMGGFGVGVICVLLLSRRWLLSGFLTFTGILVMVPLLVSGWLQQYIQRGDSDQRIATLSSRLDWWRVAWEKFVQQPMIGYGAYAAGRFVVMADLQLGTTSTMHSDWVEVLVGTGLWGLIPALLSIIGTWWVLISVLREPFLESRDRALTIEITAVMAFMTLRSVFNNTCFWHPPIMFLAVVGYAEFMRRHRADARVLAVDADLVGALSS